MFANNPGRFGACVMALLLALGGCTAEPDAVKPAETESAKAAAGDIDSRVAALVGRMTLAEKIGQMTQAERRHATPEDVKNYHLGSILNGGGSFPGDNTREEWVQMISDYQDAATSTRLGIPIIYGTDAVHGHSNVVGATIFPHNIGLGATRNPELAQKIGEATAREVAATGVSWTFAPTLCVTRDERWGRGYECFSEDPQLVTEFAEPLVFGLQGGPMNGDTLANNKIVATAKHWVGDGGTSYGTGDADYAMDRGDTRVSDEELREQHIAPYLPAIDAGVGTVMISYSSVNGKKMHEHKELVTDVLKEELGFDGFTISDWEALKEIPADTNRERVVRAVNAGVDMVMEPEKWQQFITDLTAAVEAGEVSMERIDDAVSRILKTKLQAGLFDNPLPPLANGPQAGELLGHPDHRALARQAVRESLVVLKNDGNLLPLTRGQKVFVAGAHADDIGLQSGGWTIEWQGKAGDITEGTTILEGIKDVAGGPVTFSAEGEGAAGHDLAIVVVGEQPYAEGMGDYREAPCELCKPLTLGDEQLAVLEKVQAADIPTVVVLVSGRPLLVADQLPAWDALVAAWLPGSEGAGVADVLFGDYAPTGKLPVTWPKSLKQIPINKGDADYDPLFPFGHGLTYAADNGEEQKRAAGEQQ
ncbi:glycoside hydrolase family 3 protein [Microbulbifer sp. YPW16]|uniref:glycoside hydrolase family 3 protein n=1 Tax=Microbulbifer sp. YPW16 TaxID=2904242 RepID=UPI001E4B181C|nr:glycoside hydrolase family 3 N-terminal domain-containing protein [Microbulbifer sp. YPW16]UHQ53744.1 glycoside hydrolase family 3 C-terminal domain-containing protein [Microbulbifer sp. YPW16]